MNPTMAAASQVGKRRPEMIAIFLPNMRPSAVASWLTSR